MSDDPSQRPPGSEPPTPPPAPPLTPDPKLVAYIEERREALTPTTSPGHAD